MQSGINPVEMYNKTKLDRALKKQPQTASIAASCNDLDPVMSDEQGFQPDCFERFTRSANASDSISTRSCFLCDKAEETLHDVRTFDVDCHVRKCAHILQGLKLLKIGSSAMSSRVEAGILRGRPFGGVLIMIKDSLRKIMKTVHCSDRYVIVKVGDCLFVNVYLPCVGSTDRQLICDNVVLEIGDWCSRFSDCNVIVRGHAPLAIDRLLDVRTTK